MSKNKRILLGLILLSFGGVAFAALNKIGMFNTLVLKEQGNANTVSIAPEASLSSSVSYTLGADGTVGQLLSTDGSGALGWASALSDPMTTRGDIIYRNAANATARLPIGAANTVASTDGTDISWTTVSSAMIADDSIVAADINSSAAIPYSKLAFSNNIVAGDIAADSIGSSELADASIDDPALFTTAAAASASDIGIVTTGAQSFLGTKTFEGTSGVGDNDILNVNRGNSAVNYAIGYNGSDINFYAGTTTGHSFNLRTSDIDRLEIDSSGNATFNQDLDVVGTTTLADLSTDLINTASLEFFNSSSTAATQTLRLNHANTTASATHMRFRYNNGAGGYTNQGGIVGNGSTGPAFFNGSDRRIKTNIQDMPSALDRISQIELKTWDAIDGGHGVGPIAQDLIEIYPEKVNATDDGEGELLPEGTDPWTVKTDWQYELMKCVQELKAENDALKERLSALESQ